MEVAEGGGDFPGDAGELEGGVGDVVGVEFSLDGNDVLLIVEVEDFAVGMGAGGVVHEEESGGIGVLRFESGEGVKEAIDGEWTGQMEGVEWGGGGLCGVVLGDGDDGGEAGAGESAGDEPAFGDGGIVRGGRGLGRGGWCVEDGHGVSISRFYRGCRQR